MSALGHLVSEAGGGRRPTASRNLSFLRSGLALAILTGMGTFAAESPAEQPVAEIRLFNPAAEARSSLVEIPAGTLATPALVDWENLQLSHNGKVVPHALREGRAHWRARLTSGITQPVAEDILVFVIEAPPGWSHLELTQVQDRLSRPGRNLVRQAGAIIVSFPDFVVAIDEGTGLLTRLEAWSEPLLEKRMELSFLKGEEGLVSRNGAMGPGFQRPQLTMKTGGQIPHSAKLLSWSIHEALGELHFILTPVTGPAVALTYRVYPNRQIEILCDERPWKGSSPWLEAMLKVDLALAGPAEQDAVFQTHYPFYGFKDYPAVVKSCGAARRAGRAMVFELGEESINGRFWHRRLAVYPGSEWEHRKELLDHLDEGLVVETLPRRSAPLPPNAQIAARPTESAIRDLMAGQLRTDGQKTQAAATGDASAQIVLKLEPGRGTEGDGYAIRPLTAQTGIELVAATRLGLFRGASRVAGEIKETGSAPLIAWNPVADTRAGGFGGGGHEVDFPYGTEAEWKEVFDRLISSGMNVMTCLGMWGNWKMPVKFKYMPELWSDSPEAYDEVSGAKLSEFDSHSQKSIRLLRYLRERGVKVWLWIPVGAIPTTFEARFPEATVPPRGKTPRFMHPRYRQYLSAYFKELLELYPVDGFVLIRDDNGGIDDSEEFKTHLAKSRTRHPVWEQYLIVYDMLRSFSFKGDIAVYPYFDIYEPRLESELPADLVIVGHGSGLGLLTRSFDTTGPMGDTWLDNLYVGFRVPGSAKMKRLLSDRNSFWIGGAYLGTELPWEAVGYFGASPTATVNTFRHDFGKAMFGREQALDFVGFSDAYEQLFEIMNLALLPDQWFRLTEAERTRIGQEARRGLTKLTNSLAELKKGPSSAAAEKWFSQVGLYPYYFNYHLHRVEGLARMHDLIVSTRPAPETSDPLPEPVRQQLIATHQAVYELARAFEKEAARTPGTMMKDTREAKFTTPFQELFVAGYDRSSGNQTEVKVKQFMGSLKVTAGPMARGEAFELEIELRNAGCVPWVPGLGANLAIEGEAKRLGLPSAWELAGPPMVYGDKRIVKLRGAAPAETGTARLTVKLLPPYGNFPPIGEIVDLRWQ